MMKKVILLLFLCFSSYTIFSGELANFEIVGFSNDMRYFSFAEYGLSEDSKPFSNLYIVNVRQNYFVNNGVFQNIFPIDVQIEETGTGALYFTLLQASSVLKQYTIDPLNKGKLIYVLLNGNEHLEKLNFTDYNTNTKYSVSLRQSNRVNSTNNIEAQFSIDLGILFQSKQYSFVVGSQEIYRSLVRKYVLRSIYASNDNRSLVFIVEKHSVSQKDENDFNIHYMVETISWR